jgi:HK97 family phage major capsid protein
MSESMDHVNKLIEQRNRAWHNAKEILDRAVAEKRDATAEEREATERAFADIDAYDRLIKTWQDDTRIQGESEAARSEYEQFVRPEFLAAAAEPQVDPMDAFLRGQGGRALDIDLRPVAREKRALRAGATGREFRDLTLTAGAGGNTVPTSFVRALYDYLEVYSGMRRTNATIVTTTSGEALDFPKVLAGGTAALVLEGSAIAEADPGFGKMTLNAYKYGQLLQITSELATDTGVDLVGFAARDFGRALGRVTDAAYVNGSGSSAPQGVMTAMGTGKTGGTGVVGVPTFNDLIDLVYSVNEEYRANGAQWLMRDATAGTIRKITDSDGQYLWQPSQQLGQPDRLLNFEVVTDPNVAATGTGIVSIAFGDFSAFYIRDVGTIRIERSDDYAFANDLITWRALLRTDSDLIDLTGAIKGFRGGTA